MCDPPGVVGVEPSVVLDLLHPRSAGSSSLALPLRPDVRFHALRTVVIAAGGSRLPLAGGSGSTENVLKITREIVHCGLISSSVGHLLMRGR